MGTRADLNFNTWDIPPAAFVDRQFGDDSTAVLGDGNKPFRNFNAALDASDYVIVKPCTVTDNIILSGAQRNNKHIHCMDGVEFTNGGLFISGTQITNARFTGDAIFTGFQCQLVRLISTDCDLEFECKYADNVRYIVANTGNRAPTLRFKADWLLCHCFNGAGYAVRVVSGADFQFDIKYYFESQHTAYDVRDGANGRLIINCPETRVIPNYTTNFGNANKDVLRVHQFSQDVDVTVNGDLVNRHDVPATGIGGGQIGYACLTHSNLINSTNFPRTTINGNLDSLNSPCILSWFNSRYGETNVYGNMIARNPNGGFAGSPFWLQLTNGGAGNQIFRIRDGYCQGSSRFIIGRGKFVYIFDYSIYTSDFGGAQDSNFFLEQTGTTNQELYLYNTMCEKGGVVGAGSELVKGNAVGATVYTAQTKGNVVFGATYVDQWADYAQIVGLVVPKF